MKLYFVIGKLKQEKQPNKDHNSKAIHLVTEHVYVHVLVTRTYARKTCNFQNGGFSQLKTGLYHNTCSSVLYTVRVQYVQVYNIKYV